MSAAGNMLPNWAIMGGVGGVRGKMREPWRRKVAVISAEIAFIRPIARSLARSLARSSSLLAGAQTAGPDTMTTAIEMFN